MRRPTVLAAATLSVLATVLSCLPREASAQTLERALQCLEDRRRIEALRDRQLTAADSLATLVDESGAPSGDLSRAASALEQGALDRELDLLVQRETCREAARAALPEVEARLHRITSSIARGQATIPQGRELFALQRARADLQAALSEPISLQYPELPPDPGDSQETLRGKLQYHSEIQTYLRSVEARVVARLRQLEEEARVLVDADRFLQDLAFIDEGGRLETGGSVRIRGGISGGGDDPGDMNRPLGDLSAEARDATLDFALRYSPMTPAESRRVRDVLAQFQREIQKELEQIGEQIERIEPRLSPEAASPR